MSSLTSLFETLGHRAPDIQIVASRPIPAQKPDHTIILVTVAQKLAVDKGIGCVVNLLFGSNLADMLPIGHDQTHREPEFVGLVDNIVDILEKGLIGLGRISIDQRQITI